MSFIFWASQIVTLASALFLVPQSKTHSCTPLKNHGTFSTVRVKVGMPPVPLDLVADTGINDMIIQSCRCKNSGACPQEFGKCYSEKSTSTGSADRTMAVLLSFGSGDITCLEGSDYVTVGLETVYANHSLLLMVQQKLTIRGQFEGILGLGRPLREAKHKDPGQITIPGFLDLAHNPRFSMCFNYGSDGVLALNSPKQAHPMGSVGVTHWGLDFRGISVGDAAQPVQFCSPAEKKPGMETACGLIPDSGTTLMMGSAKHINLLYEDICQRWELCRTTHADLVEQTKAARHLSLGEARNNANKSSLWARTKVQLADGFLKLRNALQHKSSEARQGLEMPTLEMSYTFQLVLQNCPIWMPKNGSVDDVIPPLFFHVAGKNGITDTLKMKPSSWVVKTPALVAHKSIVKILGVPVEVVEIAKEDVCEAAFGASEYPTELNGPIWIVGTPLFYEYTVHYDREPKVPEIAFSRESCGSCVDNTPTASASLAQELTGGLLRRIDEISMPRWFNVSQPL